MPAARTSAGAPKQHVSGVRSAREQAERASVSSFVLLPRNPALPLEYNGRLQRRLGPRAPDLNGRGVATAPLHFLQGRPLEL